MLNRIFSRCFFVVAIVFSLSSLIAQVLQVPDVEVQRLNDGKTVSIISNNASIIFFFDASYEKRNALLNEINKIAYAFRMRNLQVIGIYSDLEPEEADKEGIEKLKEQLSKMQKTLYFPLYMDLERTVLSEFGIEKLPALFVCDGNSIIYREQEEFDYFTIEAWAEYAQGFLTEEQREQRLKRQHSSFAPATENVLAETKPLPKDGAIADNGDDSLADNGNDSLADNGNDSLADNGNDSLADNGDDSADNGDDSLQNISDVKAQSEKKTEIKHINATHKRVKISPIVAAISIAENLGNTETLGYKPSRWRLSTSVDSAFFYTLTDTLINLIPLFIWGWGMLYCLGKMSRYRGMLWGLFGCFGLFLYSFWSLSCRIPFELCVVSPKLMYWKDLVARSHYFLQGEDSWPKVWQFASFGYWQVKLVVVFIFQVALVKGIAGRIKEQ